MMPGPAAAADESLARLPGGDGSSPGGKRPAGALAGLLRAAIAPVLSAAVLLVLLTVWVRTGGAGTLRRVHVEITLAAIPLSFGPGAGSGLPEATTYLEIRNVGPADYLIGARSPAARGTLLARVGRTPLARGGHLAEIALAAGATLDLNPFGRDLVLIRPRALHTGEIVPITLEFRHAGPVRVDLIVTASLPNP